MALISGLERVASALGTASRVAVLTGAGISAESGVPTFRGADGLWRQHRPEELATPHAFARDPGLVWEWYRSRRRRLATVSPNPGHFTLARLESRCPDLALVTQNVDGLHALAGSQRIVELHGNIWCERCTSRSPHRVQRAFGEGAEESRDVPVCHCGAPLRPDVVWFGEGLQPEDLEKAREAFHAADLALVVGTSSVVYPAAALPGLAKRAGALVVEINPDETPLSAQADVVLRGPSGVLLPELERLAFGE